MREKKTLFDYFKLPTKRTEGPEDVSFSDALDTYSLDVNDGITNSDPMPQDRRKRRLNNLKENSRNKEAESEVSILTEEVLLESDVENELESPFTDGPQTQGLQSSSQISLDGRASSVGDGHSAKARNAVPEEARYGFLVDVRDKNGRRRGSEGYDASSLFIPPHEYRRFTPFEKQFWDVKSEYFDTIVFFKKGKFYELYEDDALVSAKLFDFRVSDRVNMKMSGFPESSLDYWAKKFLEHGYKIAIVEQSENMIGKQIREKDERNGNMSPRGGGREKIIHRELKEVITQGTIYNAEYLRSAMPVYLMAAAVDSTCYSPVCEGRIHMSVVLYDASVSEVYFSSFCDDEERHKMKTILSQHDVKEIVCDFPIGRIPRIVPDKTPVVCGKKYDFSNEREYLCFSYLFNYMRSLKRSDALDNIRVTRLCSGRRFMVLDDITLRNMEIFRNSYDGRDEKTFFRSINFCSTPFGQRLLRRWVMAPLMDKGEIGERHRMCRMLGKIDATSVKEGMGRIGDGERFLARLYNGNPSLKDLNNFIRCIKTCGETFGVLHSMLDGGDEDPEQIGFVHRVEGYAQQIDRILTQYHKTYRVSESGISPGEDNTDELYVLLRDKEDIVGKLNEYLEKQRTRLNRAGLRFRDIGKDIFQIEAPKEMEAPAGYFIVSSTKTVNRFYSGELKGLVKKYVECEERIFQSKGLLLRRAIEAFSPHITVFHQMFNEMAHVDCYLSFNTFAAHNRTSLPVFSEKLVLSEISNPVYPGFVTNSYVGERKVLVLTGPNMGGKSTLLRTMCLNIILSQMGMGVCCERMETPVFDRIFTRIGASDDLVKGQSTFMVELSETANILRHATESSFVIIDELGRGTSTKDGECIARAVLEYLKTRGCHVVFSTHYHKIIERVDGVANGYMSSVARGRDIVFLYKLVAGVSLDSHGLYVARMAGVPDSVVDRAQEERDRLRSVSN